MLPDEIIGPVADSVNEYANEVRHMKISEILRSKFRGPDFGDDTGLDMSDPRVRHFVDFWDETMHAWIRAYGSINGYVEFNDAWAASRPGGALYGASAANAFGGSQYENIRNWYAAGGSGSYDIYHG